MVDPIVATFLEAGTEKRLSIARDKAHASALTELLGQQAYAEYWELAKQLDVSHLAIDSPKNLIFLPGVMGSLLQSRSRGGIWWIDVRTRDRIDQLGLSIDGRETERCQRHCADNHRLLLRSLSLSRPQQPTLWPRDFRL